MPSTISKENFDLAGQRSFGEPYPVYVNNLKEIGVTSYHMDVSTHELAVYSGGKSPALVIPDGHSAIACSPFYDEVALREALRRTQAGLSNFPVFLAEIAAAGIHHYRADLLERTVTYYGKDPASFYEEAIPSTEKARNE
jgi:uncharacterized protein YbcV (DUF1398 family)